MSANPWMRENAELKAEIKRLCEERDYFKKAYVTEQEIEREHILPLEAENKRLRELLKHIVWGWDDGDPPLEQTIEKARAALEGK